MKKNYGHEELLFLYIANKTVEACTECVSAFFFILQLPGTFLPLTITWVRLIQRHLTLILSSGLPDPNSLPA